MNAQNEQEIALTLIAMERAALDRWSNGDPSGYLEIYAPDVTYFDPFLDRRIDGLEELTRHYDRLRGKIFVTSEMNDSKVQIIGNAAVLTYHYVFYGANPDDKARWNCTEVYRNDGDRWQLIQTHLSVAHTEEDQV